MVPLSHHWRSLLRGGLVVVVVVVVAAAVVVVVAAVLARTSGLSSLANVVRVFLTVVGDRRCLGAVHRREEGLFNVVVVVVFMVVGSDHSEWKRVDCLCSDNDILLGKQQQQQEGRQTANARTRLLFIVVKKSPVHSVITAAATSSQQPHTHDTRVNNCWCYVLFSCRIIIGSDSCRRCCCCQRGKCIVRANEFSLFYFMYYQKDIPNADTNSKSTTSILPHLSAVNEHNSSRKMTMAPSQQRQRKVEGSLSRTSKKQQSRRHAVLVITVIVIGVFAVIAWIIATTTTLAGAALPSTKKKNAPEERKDQLQHQLPRDVVHEQRRKKEEAAGIIQQQEETLILTTKIGALRIVLRPDLSAESVQYMHAMLQQNKKSDCPKCNLYRVEKPGILQGIMSSSTVPPVTTKGSCPAGLVHIQNNNCPQWDPQCGCHGPVMTRGMVGWAAGQTGPYDFFINAYARPAEWWG